MCGIVGYIGHRDSVPILLDGLERLEYRGYDSAGLAVWSEDGILIRRCEGKLIGLKDMVGQQPLTGSLGVGHTRWATPVSYTHLRAHET